MDQYVVRHEDEFATLNPACELFICAAHPEPRASAGAQRARFALAAKSVVLDVGGKPGEPSAHAKAIAQTLSTHSPQIEGIGSADTKGMLQMLDRLPLEREIWIDCTSFPVPLLGVLLLRLAETSARHLISLYTFPNEYLPWGQSLHFETDSSPRQLDGFPGARDSRLKRMLVIQLGFEGARAASLANEFEPDIVRPVLAYPPLRPGWNQRSLAENQNLLRDFGDDYSRAPADDVEANRRVLDEIAARDGEKFSISVCPLGTKVQALGALLHAMARRETAIVYDFPRRTAANYSSGVGPTRGYEVVLPTQSS